jgi:hypothetical protein
VDRTTVQSGRWLPRFRQSNTAAFLKVFMETVCSSEILEMSRLRSTKHTAAEPYEEESRGLKMRPSTARKLFFSCLVKCETGRGAICTWSMCFASVYNFCSTWFRLDKYVRTHTWHDYTTVCRLNVRQSCQILTKIVLFPIFITSSYKISGKSTRFFITDRQTHAVGCKMPSC